MHKFSISFLFLWFLDDYEKYLKTTKPCTTKAKHPDGKGESNKSCKFPFVFKKNKKQRQNDECVADQSCVFHDCTKVGTKDGEGPEWCATEVDNKSKYIKGKWGNCEQESCKPLPNFYKNETGILQTYKISNI